MMIPSIHLNGTSRDTLLRELQDAHAALDAAITKVASMTVHGRDYYVQGPDAYSQARHEHEERLGKLYAVLHDLEALHTALYDFGGKR